MRKLGNGQSLCFFVPDEVKKAIQRMPKFQGDTITKVHLMSWSIWETFLEAEKQGPLWAKHGARHCRQQEAWRKAKENTSPNQPFINMRPDIAERYLEDEAQTLQQRYEPPRGSASHDTIDTVVGLDPSSKTPEAQFIRRRCEELGVGGLGNPSSLREEQERELSIESEEQKVVQKPGAMKAKRPVIHEDVECFVREGTIPPRSGAFRPAFEAFRDTSIAHLVELEEFPDDLLVTTEFVRTVEAGEGFVSDQYHRPVQWIVTKSIDPSTHQSVKQLVVFSPWEVNELLYLVRERGVVTVHLYAPRTSLSCRSVEDLTLYTVPPLPPAWPVPRHLIRLLNLFAGQLFLRSYDEYVKLCDFLRPAQGEVGQGTVTIIGPERPAGMTADTVLHQFTRNPKPFLRMLMANICRDTRDIRGTDLGRILTDLALDEEVFDGREPPSKCCDAMGDEMARSALVTRGQARTAKIVRIPRTFYQIFQQRYLDFPVFEMRKRGEGASGNERESGGRLVGEFESYPIRPDREVDDDSMFPERAKNIGSFALNGCSLCGRRPRSLSGGEDGARWSTNIGKLKESAPACASCALLLQAAEYMEPDRAKSKSAANDQSELEVHYPLGNTHYPVKRIFLRWEGEQRPEEKTYEVYRESKSGKKPRDHHTAILMCGLVPWANSRP
jgi:hypothetical protein